MNPVAARTLAELISATNDGEIQAKYLFFWGHTPKPGSPVGRWVLSQWYPSTFMVDGTEYATAEHWMMAEKARLFEDAEALDKVLACRTPGEAKKLGRGVRGFDQAVWEERRFDIVVEGSVHKFGADDTLRDYLTGSGDRVLVEASPRDRIWGVGLGEANASSRRPSEWRGLNLLGFALMEARERLGKAG